MNINYDHGLFETFLETQDDFKPYGCNDFGESLEKIYNDIQSYKADFSDRDYFYDE